MKGQVSMHHGVCRVQWSGKDFRFRSIWEIDLNSKSFVVEVFGVWVIAGMAAVGAGTIGR